MKIILQNLTNRGEKIMREQNMERVMEKAQVLVEALPYIQHFNRKIIVVKYGGSAMVEKK